jgi:predicted ArsR family transcriptional regulator
MSDSRWLDRLLTSTRGRVIALLRRADYTTGELAEQLGLTDNAIRAQLTALERDGLVRTAGQRREGVGKPAFLYELTPAAEKLFPRAYDRVLIELVTALAERVGRAETERILRAAGRRAASGREVPDELSPRGRLDAGLAILGDMGGDGEVVGERGRLQIRGYSCPLAAVVPHHPEACALVEELLTAALGVRVREVCDKGERPTCGFELVEASSPD